MLGFMDLWELGEISKAEQAYWDEIEKRYGIGFKQTVKHPLAAISAAMQSEASTVGGKGKVGKLVRKPLHHIKDGDFAHTGENAETGMWGWKAAKTALKGMAGPKYGYAGA